MTEQNRNEEDRRGIVSNVLTVMLAGLGAALLLEEGVERLVGRILKDDESTDPASPPATGQPSVQSTSGQPSGFVTRQIESVLRVVNLPSHSEIERLSAQVDQLSRKVDQINQPEP